MVFMKCFSPALNLFIVDKVKPNRLQDILFTGTGKKGDNHKFGPVVANY